MSDLTTEILTLTIQVFFDMQEPSLIKILMSTFYCPENFLFSIIVMRWYFIFDKKFDVLNKYKFIMKIINSPKQINGSENFNVTYKTYIPILHAQQHKKVKVEILKTTYFISLSLFTLLFLSYSLSLHVKKNYLKIYKRSAKFD